MAIIKLGTVGCVSCITGTAIRIFRFRILISFTCAGLLIYLTDDVVDSSKCAVCIFVMCRHRVQHAEETHVTTEATTVGFETFDMSRNRKTKCKPGQHRKRRKKVKTHPAKAKSIKSMLCGHANRTSCYYMFSLLLSLLSCHVCRNRERIAICQGSTICTGCICSVEAVFPLSMGMCTIADILTSKAPRCCRTP
jgi:hypothetical protein